MSLQKSLSSMDNPLKKGPRVYGVRMCCGYLSSLIYCIVIKSLSSLKLTSNSEVDLYHHETEIQGPFPRWPFVMSKDIISWRQMTKLKILDKILKKNLYFAFLKIFYLFCFKIYINLISCLKIFCVPLSGHIKTIEP